MGGGSHKNLFTNSISEIEHFPLPTGSLWCFDDWGSGLVVFLMLRLDLGLVLTRWIWDLSRTRLDPHIVLPVGDLLVTRRSHLYSHACSVVLQEYSILHPNIVANLGSLSLELLRFEKL